MLIVWVIMFCAGLLGVTFKIYKRRLLWEGKDDVSLAHTRQPGQTIGLCSPIFSLSFSRMLRVSVTSANFTKPIITT